VKGVDPAGEPLFWYAKKDTGVVLAAQATAAAASEEEAKQKALKGIQAAFPVEKLGPRWSRDEGRGGTEWLDE
jgi:hypothetical protein